MRTPAGFDCPYFYANYHRGRDHEECRLVEQTRAPSKDWNSSLCRTCPVPGILRANACPNMVLSGTVVSSFLVFGKKMKVTAYCKLSQQNVIEPEIGCGQCHPVPSFTTEKK